MPADISSMDEGSLIVAAAAAAAATSGSDAEYFDDHDPNHHSRHAPDKHVSFLLPSGSLFVNPPHTIQPSLCESATPAAAPTAPTTQIATKSSQPITACSTVMTGNFPLAKVVVVVVERDAEQQQQQQHHQQQHNDSAPPSGTSLVGVVMPRLRLTAENDHVDGSPPSPNTIMGCYGCENNWCMDVSLRDFMVNVLFPGATTTTTTTKWASQQQQQQDHTDFWQEEISVNDRNVLVMENNGNWEVVVRNAFIVKDSVEETPPNLISSFDDDDFWNNSYLEDTSESFSSDKDVVVVGTQDRDNHEGKPSFAQDDSIAVASSDTEANTFAAATTTTTKTLFVEDSVLWFKKQQPQGVDANCEPASIVVSSAESTATVSISTKTFLVEDSSLLKKMPLGIDASSKNDLRTDLSSKSGRCVPVVNESMASLLEEEEEVSPESLEICRLADDAELDEDELRSDETTPNSYDVVVARKDYFLQLLIQGKQCVAASAFTPESMLLVIVQLVILKLSSSLK